MCKKLIASHHLFLHKSPFIVTKYIDTQIRELFLCVLHRGHFTNTLCTTPPKNITKINFFKIASLCINSVVGHNLFLPSSPLSVSVTTYIDTEITEHGLGILHWGHFTHTSCTTPPKNCWTKWCSMFWRIQILWRMMKPLLCCVLLCWFKLCSGVV